MPKQIDTLEFIKRAHAVHNNYYDYSRVEYVNMHTKVKIIDPLLGEFLQSPLGHLSGQGHPKNRYVKAANKRRLTKEEFVDRARKVHGNLYDYSKVIYEHCDKKVCIIDPEYGEFWQSPYQHLRSHGCPARTKNKKWLIHKDHIIPLSVIRTMNRSNNKWFIERPLYKFLNSEVNLKQVTAKYNQEKSDFITINGKKITAGSVRNNYEIIAYLIKSQLNIDPSDLIAADKKFIADYFGL